MSVCIGKSLLVNKSLNVLFSQNRGGVGTEDFENYFLLLTDFLTPFSWTRGF